MTSINNIKKVSLKNTHNPFVSVPYWFICDYMPKAQNGYTQVYLYLLAELSQPTTSDISLEDVSLNLNMLYSEVVNALKYWAKEKIMVFNKGEDDTYDISFCLNNPLEKKQDEPAPKTIIRQTRPDYRTEEITLYVDANPPVLKLFKTAEQQLKRMLTLSDQKILFSLYDWLHMPFDLIEYLIEYCTFDNNKITMHYIEKVAISWVDEGITSLEKAKHKVASDKRYFKILSTLGASKQNLTSAEKSCMNKWLDDYNFNMDVILEACKRSVLQTSKPSLNYVDSILSSWKKSKVSSMDDVHALDKAYEGKKSMSNTSSTVKPVSNKVSQFNNMYSHNWDFDELEKLQREHIARKFSGGN